MKKLKDFVNRLESSHYSFKILLSTFFCILFLRTFLESFSDLGNFWTPVSSLAFFIHFPMFYLCLVLALTILLFLLTSEKIERITKIVILFIPLILIVPTIDLILSRGKGYNQSYLFGDFTFLIRKFITIPWTLSRHAVTPGIQIEGIIILLLVGIYVYLKTAKVYLTAVGVILSYTMIFTLGSVPSLITVLWNLKGKLMLPEEMFSGGVMLYHPYSFDHKMAFILFLLLLLELGLWFWFYDRRKFCALLKTIRGLRLLHYSCMLGIGMFIGFPRMHTTDLFKFPFPLIIPITAFFSGALAFWFAVGINDSHDVKADTIDNPSKPLVSGIINAEEHRIINMIFLILSLVAAYLVRYSFFVTILTTIGLSYIYSAPPFRLKRVPILATFILALCSAFVCLAGYSLFSEDASFKGFPFKYLIAIIVPFTFAFTVKDIKDMKGDRKTGINTLITLFGEKSGKIVTGLLVSISYISIPIILKSFILMPFALICALPSYFLINSKHMRETPIFLIYFLFLGIVLYSSIRGF